MSLFIEYYEVKTGSIHNRCDYEYYYMLKDLDAKNRENMDQRSVRIWRFNTRSNRITEVMNRSKDTTPINSAEFFKIQLVAKPVPWDENYLFLQRVREHREQHQTEESSTLD